MSAPRCIDSLRRLASSSVRSQTLRSLPSRRLIASTSASRAALDPTTASVPTPPPPGGLSQETASPKVNVIVDQISGLSLLEAADLVKALKTRLNIADIALPTAVAAAPAAADAGAAAAAAPAEVEKPKEKTVFTLHLKKIDSTLKAKVIKEVKGVMPNMNLVEAKKFVESLPQMLKENMPKEDAEKLKKALEAVGAEVSME